MSDKPIILNQKLIDEAAKELISFTEGFFPNDPEIEIILSRAVDISTKYSISLSYLIGSTITGTCNSSTQVIALEIAIAARLSQQEADAILTKIIWEKGSLVLAIHVAVLLQASEELIKILINALQDNKLWHWMIDSGFIDRAIEERSGEKRMALILQFPLTPEIEEFYTHLIRQTRREDGNSNSKQESASHKKSDLLFSRLATRIKKILMGYL